MSRGEFVIPMMRCLVGTRYDSGIPILSNKSVPAVHVWQQESAKALTVRDANVPRRLPFQRIPNLVCAACMTDTLTSTMGEAFGRVGTKSVPSHSQWGGSCLLFELVLQSRCNEAANDLSSNSSSRRCARFLARVRRFL